MEFLIHMPDINCYVAIYRNNIAQEECNKLYNVLSQECVVRHPIRDFRGNMTVQQRTNHLYADDHIKEMKYSSANIPAYKWHPMIEGLRNYVSLESCRFDSCLVNGYLDTEKDKVSAHRDFDLKDGMNMVCTVSIGGTRLMRFRPYKNPTTKENICPIPLPDKIETYLNNGDVLYMHGNTNLYFTHEIPTLRKTIDHVEPLPRYSATFRKISDTHLVL